MMKIKSLNKRNITLIGLMGSGKSVIGKSLSKKYQTKYYDSDNEIEKEIGMDINKIFKIKGEVFFRSTEEKICKILLEKYNCVISLGGGSIQNSKTRELIKKNSFSIYLKVDINILSKRLSNSDKRPLLKNGNIKDILKDIYRVREKHYNNADLIIENNFDKNSVINEICKNIELK